VRWIWLRLCLGSAPTQQHPLDTSALLLYAYYMDIIYTLKELNWAADEVARQGGDAHAVVDFLNAWTRAKRNCGWSWGFDLEETIQQINMDAAPALGGGWYRHTPVIFANGNKGAPAMEIPRLMRNLCESGLFGTDLEAFVIEFLKIHPFIDGNGRTAAILLNHGIDHLRDNFVSLPNTPEGWLTHA